MGCAGRRGWCGDVVYATVVEQRREVVVQAVDAKSIAKGGPLVFVIYSEGVAKRWEVAGIGVEVFERVIVETGGQLILLLGHSTAEEIGDVVWDKKWGAELKGRECPPRSRRPPNWTCDVGS